MSINSNMKMYKMFIVECKKNDLQEDIKDTVFLKEALISIHEKTVNFIDSNGIYKREIVLQGITRDDSIKEGMVIKVNDKFFTIKHIKVTKRINTLQFKETDYVERDY